MKNKIIFLIFGMIFLIGIMNFSSAFLGTFQQNSCVPLQVNLNTSAVNLSSVTVPEFPTANYTAYSIPFNQTVLYTFQYDYCGTNVTGHYIYSFNDAEGNTYVNDFDIDKNSAESIFNIDFNKPLNIILLIVVLALFLFFSLIGWGIWGGVGYLIIGIVMLSNNVSFIISLIIIIMGILQMFLFDKLKT